MTESTITVSGSGSAAASPDVARINLACVAQTSSAASALRAVNSATAKIYTVLSGFGVPSSDAPTGSFNLYTSERHDDQQNRHVTYVAEQQVVVTVRKIELLGEILGEVVQAGGNEIRLHNVEMALTDTTKIGLQALGAAWTDATARAQHLAEAASTRLGEVLAVRERTESFGGQPRMMAQSFAADANSVTINPDAVSTSAAIEVTWTLVPATN